MKIELGEFGVGKAAGDLLEEQVDVGGGLIHGDAGFEAADGIEGLGEIVFVSAKVGRDGFNLREGNPDLWSFADDGAEELLRSDADDGVDDRAEL